MARKALDAILWRKYLSATSHAVWEVSSSQYYFELPEGDYQQFFAGKCQISTDDEGNEAFTISLEPFDGEQPVGPHDVTFTKKRPGSRREGKWTVDSIRDGRRHAYDLWRRKRGPIEEYGRLPVTEKEKNYIVVVRDVDGGFHGRWIRGSDFDDLPASIKGILLSAKAGWSKL